MKDKTFYMTNEKFRQGCVLDYYNNKISICSANEGKDGKVYVQWCYPQKIDNGKKIPNSKSLPWKVEIGTIKEAMELFKNYYKFLENLESKDKELF